MRLCISILLLTICHLALPGQSAVEVVVRLKQQEASSRETTDMAEANLRGSWNFSVGTSYSYIQSLGSGMMFYAVPSYTMPLNDRWALHGGLWVSQFQGAGSIHSGEGLLPGSFSNLALFTAASYQMSDRILLHGAGVKQLVSAPVTPFTPYPMDNLSLGATFKLGDNISIGASLHMNNGRRGYYSTPFTGPFHSPIYW